MQLWHLKNRTLLLASASPRRRELLAKMGIVFDVVQGTVLDESSYLDPSDCSGSAMRLACAKAEDAAQRYPQAAVLSADTIVVLDGKILGKPGDASVAKNMLCQLSGRQHQVITGIALTCCGSSFMETRAVTTSVWFRHLSQSEIEWYIDSGEPFDKAGGYGIQGKAMIFVEKIDGCYYNVVGLPIQGTIDLFKAFDAKGIP